MCFEEALKNLIEAATTVTDIVGSRIALGGFAEPGTAKPYLVYEILSDDEPGHLTGTSGLSHALVQFRCVGADMEAAIDLRTALYQALNAYSDTDGVIQSIRVENRRTGPLLTHGGAPTPDCSAELDLMMWYAVEQAA